jgi:hypothetical protein
VIRRAASQALARHDNDPVFGATVDRQPLECTTEERRGARTTQQRRAVFQYRLVYTAEENRVSAARHLAVWIAAIVFFVLGAIWYSALSAQWLSAIGKTTEQMATEQGGSPVPFVIGFVAIVVMCYTLAWLIERLQATTFAGGMGLGVLIALGFISANLALNYGFEWRNVALWVINAVYATVGLAVAGAIIGGWKRPASEP